MKYILIGRGKMGKLIRETASAAGDEIQASFGHDDLDQLGKLGRVADVVIDFSRPEALPEIASYVRRTGTALLSGTTGLTQQDQQVLTELGRYAPVLHSANYSVGVAVMRRVVAEITPILKGDFDIEIVETHHNKKVDAPSGTAKLLLDAADPNHEMRPVAGEHTVSYFGVDEVLEVVHKAGSRQIFVNGALMVARKLVKMPKGRYELQDILFGGSNA